MTTAIIALIGGILSGIVVTIGTIIGQKIARNHEYKQRFRELALKAGLDNWRYQTDLKVKAAEKGNDVRQLPPEIYICHMLKVMDLAGNISMCGQEIAAKIEGAGKK